MEEEIINLASFEFKIDALESSIEATQTKMFELKKTQDSLTASSKELQKQEKALVDEQNRLIATNQRGSAAYNENKAKLEEVKTAQLGVYQGQKDLAIQQSVVTSEYQKTVKVYQTYLNSEGAMITATEAATEALSREIMTINMAREANSSILKIRNDLNTENEEEAKLLKQLNEQYDVNQAYIKANTSAYENIKQNIGNYTNSIIDAYAQIKKEKEELKSLNLVLIEQRDALSQDSDEWKALNGAIEENQNSISRLNGRLGEANESIEGTSSELEGANSGFLGFIKRANDAGGVAPLIGGAFAAMRAGIVGATQAAIAFIATPLGATIAVIAVVLGLIIAAWSFTTNAMKKTEEGSQKLNKFMAIFRGTLKALGDVLKPLAEFIFDYVVSYFNMLADAASAAADAVADALEFLGFDDAAKDIRDYKEEVKESVKAAQDLADAEDKLADAQRRATRVQLEYQKQAEKLRQERDDETKSINERIKANEQLGVTLKNQLVEELSIAKQALNVAELRIKAEGATTEALDARADALTEIADIEERITGQESEQLVNRNSLIKEGQEKAKEAAQKRAEAERKRDDDFIKNAELELEIFIQNQGVRKKGLEEEFRFAKNLRDDRLRIEQERFTRGLVSQKEFEVKRLEIENEYSSKVAELAVENADYELELFKLNNQQKINDNAYFSEQIYNQELDRIDRINEAEKNALKVRYNNGLLNFQEYDLALKQLESDSLQEREDLTKERDAAKKESEAADLALKREAETANLQYDLAAQLEEYQIGYNERKKAAIEAGANMTLFEAAEAEKRKKIEEAVMNNKLELASQTFGNLAAIFGSESKAGKAAAVAQATIDTYKAANAAYASLAGIPIVGPVLGGIAAGAAVAAGIANVKKITSVKSAEIQQPSYRRGIIGLEGAGSSFSDSITANLSKGESVINSLGTSRYSNTLSAINAQGNGEFSDNYSVQSAIMKDAGGNGMSEMIANAVARGAAEGTAAGSEKGLTNLSNNRQIAKNAEF